MRDKLLSQLHNDSELTKLNNLKDYLIGLHTPKIMFNLVTEKLEYVIEHDNIKMVDALIDERIKKLINMGNQELLDLMVLFEENKIELYNDEYIYINFENLNEFVDIFTSDELDESPFNCRLDLGRVSVKLSDVCFSLGIEESEIIKRLSDV